jgi:hypothetical protein
MTAIEDIAAERQRQIAVEGWTPEHDDKHGRGELARAAAAYAYHAAGNRQIDVLGYTPERGHFSIGWFLPAGALWPFTASWWKAGDDNRRKLVKAGALIVAEIERLDRAAIRARGTDEVENGN